MGSQLLLWVFFLGFSLETNIAQKGGSRCPGPTGMRLHPCTSSLRGTHTFFSLKQEEQGRAKCEAAGADRTIGGWDVGIESSYSQQSTLLTPEIHPLVIKPWGLWWEAWDMRNTKAWQSSPSKEVCWGNLFKVPALPVLQPTGAHTMVFWNRRDSVSVALKLIAWRTGGKEEHWAASVWQPTPATLQGVRDFPPCVWAVFP